MKLKKFFSGTLSCLFVVANFSVCLADVQLGDKGEQVEEVQRLLIAKNFLTGEADGDFGEETENALKNFQRENGLDADGICGEETLKLLRGEKKSTTEKTSTSEMKLGDNGESVSEIQSILIRWKPLFKEEFRVFMSMLILIPMT